ncbi:MAG: Glyceraldehyde-3-phosphate dehydrogenase / erythrose 4 phosphate dehydrogenase [Parcubacteria group bacterium GW2011_GWB1_42_9]|nr:MAG: Glyceraldehyde-3-phosphate dehydrogenase / erythrose 4 phosphate dehydrogenase [Parcubacteria group bacterium GW2011_GWB1_42_9]
MVKVAINGLGRIGRAFLKVATDNPQIEIVAVNDLGDLDNLAYLLKYDSAYGKWSHEVKAENGQMVIDGKAIRFCQEKDPANLPWKELSVDVVVESTGVFETFAKAKAHIEAGARKAVISAPVKDAPIADTPSGTFLLGINDETLSNQILTSNGSCTTNCAAPVIKILDEAIGIEKALLNTTHGYTATQKLVDVADAKDWRRGRAGAVNLIPSTTGAAIAVGQVIPAMQGKFDGIAVRVPVITGSMIDVTFIAKRDTTVEEVNEALAKAAQDPRWQKTFTVTKEALVSSDILGDSHASIADLSYTKVVGGNLVKVMAWYDNEMGYTHSLVEHVIKLAS